MVEKIKCSKCGGEMNWYVDTLVCNKCDWEAIDELWYAYQVRKGRYEG